MALDTAKKRFSMIGFAQPFMRLDYPTSTVGRYTGVDMYVGFQSVGGTTYTLSCDVGSYTLTGTDAALVASRVIVCDVGSYTLTGTDAGLVHGYNLACDVGSYALTGIDATFVYSRVLVCDVGAYTGIDATLTYNQAAGQWSVQGDASGTWTLQSNAAGSWTVQ
jgi:ethanolamine transporter EutH